MSIVRITLMTFSAVCWQRQDFLLLRYSPAMKDSIFHFASASAESHARFKRHHLLVGQGSGRGSQKLAKASYGCLGTGIQPVPRTLPDSGVYLWGAAAKGVMCANLLHGVHIEGCVDKNPFKQGKFVPGTGYPVISPTDITFPTVRAVLVENDVYLEEIQLEVMKLDPRIQVYSLHLALHIGTDTVDLFP